MGDFTISQLARETNVNVETIRYYERLGLMEQPLRSSNGYRHYSDHETAQLQFIRKTQALGFTLKEIKQLINLRHNPGSCCNNIQTLIENKLVHIHQQIQKLQTIETQLKHYAGSGKKDLECSLLDALWPPETKKSTLPEDSA